MSKDKGNSEPLTKKERWVLEQLERGMFLRVRQFSWLYEIAPTRTQGSLRANDSVGPVNRSIVDGLRDKKLICIGLHPESFSCTYVLTNKGRAAISSQKNIFASDLLSKVEK